MAIFDSVRGFVPLPKHVGGKGNDSGNNSLEGEASFVPLSPLVPIPLPNLGRVDVGNTLSDRVFAGIDGFFNNLQLPTPAFATEIYKDIQFAEEIISNPLGFLRNTVDRTIYNLLHPREKFLLDKPYPLPPDKSWENRIGKSNFLSGIEGYEEGLYAEPDLELVRTFKGRETIKDLTIRSVDMWDMRVEPFHYHDKQGNVVPNTWVPPLVQRETWEINKKSRYSDMYPSDKAPNMSDFVPVMSYSLDLKTLTSKQITMYGGSTISIPELIRYNSTMTLQIVDDENKRWRRWLQTYAEKLYDEKTAVAAPYKNSSLLITLYEYRSDFKVLSYNKYICSLSNYSLVSAGMSDATADLISIELSVVGRVEIEPEYSYLQIV